MKNFWIIAGSSVLIAAYLWGALNGSLARGSFFHQQIVAVVVGIFIAKLAEALVPKQLRK